MLFIVKQYSLLTEVTGTVWQLLHNFLIVLRFSEILKVKQCYILTYLLE